MEFIETASEGVSRARQFMPFMALKGFFDVCRERERVPEPKHELTEEESLALSQTVAALSKGDMVRVRHYDHDAYITTQGILTEVVPELGYLRIVRAQIPFADICEIEKVERDSSLIAG